jgi:transposase
LVASALGNQGWLVPVGEFVKGSRIEPSAWQIHLSKEHAMAKRKQQSTFERLTSGKLNRKQRKELIRKIDAEDPGLEIIYRNAAGIDVGNESHMVAVPPDRDPQPVREFGSWTKALQEMADWLKACGIESVVMQSMGVYWVALYDVLEERGFKVCLTNARDTKNLPGRKSDVQEAQWLRKLYSYGLLRNSFRPPEQIRMLRSLWRLRDRHVKDAAEEIQHMQKALTQMNVQLANTVSDVSGVTGQAIIRAILGGERDPYQLADLRDYRIQASREEIARSLEGTWREDMLFELQQVVDRYDFCQRQIQQCDQRLKALLAEIPGWPALPGEAEKEKPASQANPKRRGQPDKVRKARKNQPTGFDLEAELKRICGVDLTRIEGIKVMTIQTFVSEIGTDMSAFASEGHLLSWLGLVPNRQVSGGKLIRHERKKNTNRAAAALRMAASTLDKSDSYLGARFRYLRARLGPGKTIKAMAAYLARLIYRMLTRGGEWVDRGAAEFETRRKNRQQHSLQRLAKELGYTLVPAA